MIERRAKDEATGEVESLTNKMSGTKMGADTSEQSQTSPRRKKPSEPRGTKPNRTSKLADSLTEVSGVYYRLVLELVREGF